MDRISRLRKHPLNNEVCIDDFYYKFYKYYTNNDATTDDQRYTEAFYYAFSNMTPSISEDELIVGKYSQLTPEEAKEWKEKYSEIILGTLPVLNVGQDSHMSIDYDIVLKLGINGIIEKIDNYISNCNNKNKITFYNNCKSCLNAIIKHSKNYSDKAIELAKNTKDTQRRKELEIISAICKKVPANPAESFYEAIQAVHFVTYCISLNPLRYRYQQFQLGHPDRYLWPYYLNDIQNGNITKEYAQLLLNCLGIQINNRVPNGLSSGYMVGGRDEYGNIVANELTDMCMQVVDDIRLVYPSVGFCYTEGIDDTHLKKACEIISHGCSHPAIFNDDIITKGLKSYGVSEKEASNYIHSTCVEITPIASSNVWVASPYTNMPQLLLDILDREYKSYDDLIGAYFKKLDVVIQENFQEQCRIRKVRCENNINPLLSCFVNDCLVNGTDIEQGGARYNWIMPSFVGMANLVDSLYTLKELVFEKKEFTISELKQILDKNYEGEELLRLRILKSIPKYGNDIDEIDSYFGLITEHIISECKNYCGVHQNANLIPSVFCWVMHEKFGRVTGATPDGRKAGFPLGDGSGPCQGREMNGPTASILSSTKWAHYELIGGVAVNMKFSKKSLGIHSLNTMKSLIKTFIKRGGFEMQINVIDKETLKKAVTTPENYKDLVVRIGGYSDYFVKLSPEMQKEIILRTEHNI